MTKGLNLKELRAGGWRGPESAEGAGPRSPPASAVHCMVLYCIRKE